MTTYAQQLTINLNDDGTIVNKHLIAVPVITEDFNGQWQITVNYPTILNGYTKVIRWENMSSTHLNSSATSETGNTLNYNPPNTWAVRGTIRMQFIATSGTNEWASEIFTMDVRPVISTV